MGSKLELGTRSSGALLHAGVTKDNNGLRITIVCAFQKAGKKGF